MWAAGCGEHGRPLLLLHTHTHQSMESMILPSEEWKELDFFYYVHHITHVSIILSIFWDSLVTQHSPVYLHLYIFEQPLFFPFIYKFYSRHLNLLWAKEWQKMAQHFRRNEWECSTSSHKDTTKEPWWTIIDYPFLYLLHGTKFLCFCFRIRQILKSSEGEFYFLETELGSSLEGSGKAKVAWLRLEELPSDSCKNDLFPSLQTINSSKTGWNWPPRATTLTA